MRFTFILRGDALTAGQIPLYFFTGGAAGSAAVIGVASRWIGRDHELTRDCRYVAAAGTALSSALLISDLGRPASRGVLSGPVPLMLRVAAVFAGRRRSRQLRKAAAVSSIASSMLTWVGWLRAGYASARDWRLPLEAVTNSGVREQAR